MVYPNPLASGSVPVLASLLFTGSGGANYCTLGQPAALTSVLTPTTEFTVIVRTARATAVSTGIVIAQGDNANTTFGIFSLGGSQVSCSVGGNNILSGSGTIQNPTWNCVALVNRNAGSGVFKSRLVLDGAAGVAEVTSGTQVSVKDIMIGARRNSSNADASQYYSGNIGTISIYNVALTDDQIHYIMGYVDASQMINGLYGPSAGLIAFYPCNEGSGTVVNDCVAGNNGTLTSNVFSTAQYPKPPMVTVGDSLTAGDGSQTGTPYGNQVLAGGAGSRNMRSVYVYAFPGMNDAYVLTQIQLPSFAPFLNWTMVMRPGIHDLSTAPASVISFIQSVVAMLPHNRWLVVGQKPDGVGTSGAGNPNAAGDMDYGTTERLQVDALNYGVAAFCGARWVNIQPGIVALAVLPTDANDVFQNRMPVPACADSIHELNNAYISDSKALDVAATALGY